MPHGERPAPGRRVLDLWRRLEGLPGGRWLFHRLLFRMVPYSGSTGARVVALGPGHAEVRLPDRRRIRNHLRSIHALALGNVGELASGLAMLTALPSSVRGIVVRLEIDFTRKARETVTAVSTVELPELGPWAGPDGPDGDADAVLHEVVAELTDGDGEQVARTVVTWRLAVHPAHPAGPGS